VTPIETAFRKLIPPNALSEESATKARHSYFYGAWWTFDLIARKRATADALRVEHAELVRTNNLPFANPDGPSLAGGIRRWLKESGVTAASPPAHAGVELHLFLGGAKVVLDHPQSDEGLQELLDEISDYLHTRGGKAVGRSDRRTRH